MSTRVAERLEQIKKRKKFWKDDAEALMGIVFILLIIGSVNVFSSSFVYAETNFGSPYFFLKKQGINVIGGLVFFFLGLKVRYQTWRDSMGPIFLGLCALLVAVLVVGVEVNGAKRWLSLGPVGFQPSEFAKVVSVFIMASYVSEHMRRGVRCQLINGPMLFLGIIFALIELEPDGATASACLMAPVVLLFLSNMRNEHKLMLSLLGCLGVVGVFLMQPYRLQRLMATFNPWAHARDEGYQLVQSLSAIGSGGLSGMGLGMGISKYAYLPEAHTDFAFAIFSQENGFLGVCFVLLLFLLLLFYGMRIASKRQDPLGRCLAIGLTLLLVLQALANMFMVAGIIPVIGVPLPFISYGGSSLFASMLAVGIIMNIDRQPQAVAVGEEPPKPPPPPTRQEVYQARRARRGERPYLHRVK